MALVNVKKVPPLPIEGRIGQCYRIREAVFLGLGDPRTPSLLVFRNDESEDLAHGDFMNAICAAVADADSKFCHSSAESLSRIGRQVIMPLAVIRAYPQSENQAHVYEEFASEMATIYDNSLETWAKNAFRV